MGYTKLFSEIIGSTVWRQPEHIRLVWVTMLALKDERHQVRCSIPGLADFARVPIDKCQDALKVLSSPDHYSRTKDHEGRRIEECDGGWFILNGEKFRRLMSEEDRKEYQKSWIKQKRMSIQLSTNVAEVDCVDTTEQNITEQNKKEQSTPSDGKFGIFWKAYPKKVGKLNALKEWKKLKVTDEEMPKIMEGIEKQKKGRKWMEGFILDPERFIKGMRWNDEVEKLATNASGSTIDPSFEDWSKILEHIKRKGTSVRIEGISDRGRSALFKIGGMSTLGMSRSDQMSFLQKDFKNAYLSTE